MKKSFNKIRNIQRTIICILVLLTSVLTACKKLVSVDSPLNAVTTENAFNEDGSAAAVFNGFYGLMSRNAVPSSSVSGFVGYYPALSADEFILRATQTNNYYLNSLTADVDPSLWEVAYTEIFNINTALEGLRGSNRLNAALKNQLYAQALFLRAFTYFYLTGLYGDVPLVLTTDYKVNNLLPRAAQKQIYAQLITDLKEAESLIRDGYVGSDGRTPSLLRITPNKAAVQALLARVYLFNQDYPQAEETADKVIAQTNLYGLESLDRVFLTESKEAIWNLQPVNNGWNTEDGRAFVLPSGGPDDQHKVSLNRRLVRAFEKDDERRKNWIDSVTADGIKYYYPTKYKNGRFGESVTEYKMVLRFAEMFLIRAECRAMNNDLSGALEDLDKIRERAGLATSSANGKAEILEAIQNERRVELFTEWADRWLNMRRTGTINQVMPGVTADKNKTWNPDQALYPIPKRELDFNPNLTQNKGY